MQHFDLPSTPTLAPGLLVGEYVLDARVGRGATGEVWRAHHHVWSERIAAVKIPTNQDFLRTIRHEGIVHDDLAGLESPHLVKVFGMSVAASPPYIVMQFVDGSDLRQRLLKGGPLKLNEALRILEGTLKGLAIAHQRGIVHRDIKPENILLDQHGTALLTDFSIATRAPSVESLRLSIETDPGATQSLAGTLVYMSPEQRQGGRVDQRSDIYSLGLLLFEMLTGDIPQPGDTLKEFLPTIPDAVEALFLRCFQRADRRFSDASTMLAALQTLHEDGAAERISGRAAREIAHFGPSATRDAPRLSRTTARLSTRDLPSPLEAKEITQAAQQKAVLSTRSMESVRERARANAQVPVQPEEASRPSETPARKFEFTGPSPTLDRRRLVSKPAGIDDLKKLLDELPDDAPKANGTAARPDGELKNESDPRPSRAFDEVLPSLNVLYRQQESAPAVSLYTSGNFRKAMEEFQRVLEISPEDLQARKGMALCLLKMDRPKQALSVYRELLARDASLSDVWNNVGVLSMGLNRLKEAEKALLMAIELRPRYASAHSNLGAVYQRMGRSDDAKRHAEIALEIDPDNMAASYNSIL